MKCSILVVFVDFYPVKTDSFPTLAAHVYKLILDINPDLIIQIFSRVHMWKRL